MIQSLIYKVLTKTLNKAQNNKYKPKSLINFFPYNYTFIHTQPLKPITKMHFFFGSDKKQDPKITNEFIIQVKSTLTNQFCEFCKKLPATKVVFVPDGNRGFTCNSCELKAVGNDLKNLGEKTLITNDKLSESITKGLINYQNIQVESPQQVKETENQTKLHIKSSKESIQKIKGEMKLLKLTCDNKLNDLIKASQTQNSSVIFEQLNRKSKQKKGPSQEIVQLVCRKALVNKRGLHFVDEEAIEKANNEVNEKLDTLKGEIKIRLKEIDQLTSWINHIQF